MSARRVPVRAASILAALAAAVLAAGCHQPPAGRDYILTGAKPDKLFVIDAAARQIKSSFAIPDANGMVATIVPSPDGRIAYVLVNRMETIEGIDLNDGKLVFCADLSTPAEQVKDFFALDVTPDGRELIAYEMPTKLEPSEYVVQQPRFAIFETNAGLNAKPARVFEAPRRVHMILAKQDGKSFYALGFELFEYDLASGKLIEQRGIRSWNRPNHGQPDVLAFWPATEPAGVFTTPVYADETTAAGTVPKTALMSLDTKTGALNYDDFEQTSALIFSSIMDPSRKLAYGVYTQLTQIDTQAHAVKKRVNLDHTYYAVTVASDGSEVYLGGTMCDIAFYDPTTLTKRADLALPGCPDQSLASMRVIRR
jgi:quinohemoprotein amine dehydrogenase beta subunit